MASTEWLNVRGSAFSPVEAREASDFREVLRNFGMAADRAYNVFRHRRDLSTPKRLVFAELANEDLVSEMLLVEDDERVRTVIQERFAEMRKEDSGGIIIS